MPRASSSPAPWEVFFDTFDHLTHHLPAVTATGMRLRPGSPAQRALEEAQRRALHTAWKVEGAPYAKALEVAARLHETALAWLRRDGVNRQALRAGLSGVAPETRAPEDAALLEEAVSEPPPVLERPVATPAPARPARTRTGTPLATPTRRRRICST